MKLIFCHRRPDRTLRFKGRYFPVCARCTGIYIGAILTILLHYFTNFEYFANFWFGIDDNIKLNIIFLILILMIPTAIDGTTQLLKWRESRNWIRVSTGLFCGIGYGLILIYW